MTDQQKEQSAAEKLNELESSITSFIKELAASVVPDLDQIDPEIRAAFLLKALKILNKND